MKENNMLYRVLYILFYMISLLPFRLLYCLSDFAYLLIYYVARYRRKIVRSNLTTSFPDKGASEIRRIERGFYHFLCDYLFETIKLLSISREDMMKHIEFRNLDQVEDYFDRGQTCAGILGHYGNWEWLSVTGIAFQRHTDAIIGLVYHPLFNKAFDKVFLSMRQKMGGVCIPKNEILRRLVEYKRDRRMSLVGYISDQSPKWENIHLWLDFLNHDTPVFTGAERIMRKMNNAVFYLNMRRTRRGHYVCTYQLITDKPQEMEEFEITRRFFKLLEQSIHENPETYLWTHNRWKRTHEEFDRRFNRNNRQTSPK